MATPYIGEVRIFAGAKVPTGWHLCDGSVLKISEYQSLFSLIGTVYGGNGTSTFALPDLRGRLPISAGTGTGLTQRVLGATGGAETVTLTAATVPSHTHALMAGTGNGTTATVGAAVTLAAAYNSAGGTNQDAHYLPGSTGIAATVQLNAATIGNGAGGQPHDNIMPVMPVNYLIALVGEYPTQ